MKIVAAMIAIIAAACGQKEPAHRHPNAIAAAQRCAHVYGGLEDIAPERRRPAIVDACADVIVEKPCRDAFVAADDGLVDACASAYCAILPEPKPARCGDPKADAAALWRAIHLFDLGPEATQILDDAKPAPPAPPPTPPAPRLPKPDDVTWRVPIVTVTKDTLTLAFRPPQGDDAVALTMPLASWSCPKLREILALEVMNTWPNTVRPTRSKQLLLAASPDTNDKTAFDIMACLNDRSGPRQLYPDVALTVQR